MRRIALAITFAAFVVGCDGSSAGRSVPPDSGPVPVWGQFSVEFRNPFWRGNALDVEFSATFKHVSSGRILRHLGYYTGSKTWRIRFMPDEPGEWQYVTQSDDSDLDGHRGEFEAVPSSLEGPLVPRGNRWYSSEGRAEFPVMLMSDTWFRATDLHDGVADFINWSKDVAGARIIGQVLVNPPETSRSYVFGRFLGPGSYNLAVWNRLNGHFDALRDAGLGHYIMIYTDDEGAPDRLGIAPYSKEERRLLRYVVARFAPYPTVIWDSGIDIGEYRDDAWVDWFANWIQDNDPWNHPVGSRSGGGSGGHHPTNATYWSDGAKDLPRRGELTETIKQRNVPTFFTDRWRENFGRGNFNRDSLRRAAWSLALAGGAGFSTAGAYGSLVAPPFGNRYDLDLEVAPDLGNIVRFVSERVEDYCALMPSDDLSSSEAFVAANPNQEYVVYDFGDGNVTLDLVSATGTFSAAWFNPIAGTYHAMDRQVSGGTHFVAERPSAGDFALHLLRERQTAVASP